MFLNAPGLDACCPDCWVQPVSKIWSSYILAILLPFQPILWNRCFPSKSVKSAQSSPESISEGGRIWRVCPNARRHPQKLLTRLQTTADVHRGVAEKRIQRFRVSRHCIARRYMSASGSGVIIYDTCMCLVSWITVVMAGPLNSYCSCNSRSTRYYCDLCYWWCSCVVLKNKSLFVPPPENLN